MRIGNRYQFAREQQERYWAAGTAERSRILDAFCLATGCYRKYAITMLRGRRRVLVRSARRRARRYGLDFQKGLRVAWEASGYICSERLQPFLPELVPRLEKHAQLPLDDPTRKLLLQASVSTVERNVRVPRDGLVSRKMSQTKPGTLLRRQIPAVPKPRQPFRMVLRSVTGSISATATPGATSPATYDATAAAISAPWLAEHWLRRCLLVGSEPPLASRRVTRRTLTPQGGSAF